MLLILVSNFSSLVNRTAVDFYIESLYPVTQLNLQVLVGAKLTYKF